MLTANIVTFVHHKNRLRHQSRHADRDVVFFSSRRRHTRYIGDWSSDVCSSDLAGVVRVTRRGRLAPGFSTILTGGGGSVTVQPQLVDTLSTTRSCLPKFRMANSRERRSEERRVGKEASSRGSRAIRDQDQTQFH